MPVRSRPRVQGMQNSSHECYFDVRSDSLSIWGNRKFSIVCSSRYSDVERFYLRARNLKTQRTTPPFNLQEGHIGLIIEEVIADKLHHYLV